MNTKFKMPNAILYALQCGAALAISVSGGKDSQAMTHELLAHPDRPNWTGKIYLIHADLGKGEWFDTPSFVKQWSEQFDVPFVVVKRKDNAGVIEHIKARAVKLLGTGKPAFPDAFRRFCTSDLKRLPLNQNMQAHDFIISVEGIRHDESAKRASKPIMEIRKSLAGKRFHGMSVSQAINTFLKEPKVKNAVPRLAIDYRPIVEYNQEDVFNVCGHTAIDTYKRKLKYKSAVSAMHERNITLEEFTKLTEQAFDGWNFHNAYIRGNSRLSCALCILASKNDLLNGAIHNREAFQDLSDIEDFSDSTFKNKMSLKELVPELEAYDAAYAAM